MTIATGVFMQVAYKAETTYGTAPAASGAQILRRVESTLDLTKDTYQSNEKRSDQQVSDFRHGVRRVAGKITGELSPRTYQDFFAAILRRDFAAVTAIAGASITIALGSVVGNLQSYTVTRAAGSFITDGVKIGDVIRLSVGSFNAANLSKNMLVIGLTATAATVLTLNGSALVAEGPIATSTVTVIGKKSYVPTSGHTDKSFSIEHWYPDIVQNELFTGCKLAQAALNLPPTGIATIDWDVQGQDVTRATSRYYSAPTAANAFGVEAAVNGLLVAAGVPLASVTGMSVNINGNYGGGPVVGQNKIPQVFPGRVTVSGQLTAYFDSVSLRDAFIDETDLSLIGVFAADNTAASDFVGFTLPRIKLGGASKDDPEQGKVQTLPFTALFNGAGGAGTTSEQSTIVVQDSQAA